MSGHKSKGKKGGVSAVSSGNSVEGSEGRMEQQDGTAMVVLTYGSGGASREEFQSSGGSAAAALLSWWCMWGGEAREGSRGEGCGEIARCGVELNRRNAGVRWSQSSGVQGAGEAGACCLGGPGWS